MARKAGERGSSGFRSTLTSIESEPVRTWTSPAWTGQAARTSRRQRLPFHCVIGNLQSVSLLLRRRLRFQGAHVGEAQGEVSLQLRSLLQQRVGNLDVLFLDDSVLLAEPRLVLL